MLSHHLRQNYFWGMSPEHLSMLLFIYSLISVVLRTEAGSSRERRVLYHIPSWECSFKTDPVKANVRGCGIYSRARQQLINTFLPYIRTPLSLQTLSQYACSPVQVGRLPTLPELREAKAGRLGV